MGISISEDEALKCFPEHLSILLLSQEPVVSASLDGRLKFKHAGEEVQQLEVTQRDSRQHLQAFALFENKVGLVGRPGPAPADGLSTAACAGGGHVRACQRRAPSGLPA
jgi:hypothetical protein